MRQPNLTPFIMALFIAVGAAPTRTKTYTSGEVISPTDVTENEDNIFQYLQAGVDTYKVGSVDAAAIGSGAVTTDEILDNTVSSADILDNTVSSADILDATITTEDIANNAVTGTKIAIGADAQGDIIYYNGTDYARLGAGSAGQFLETQGAAANPRWVTGNAMENFTRLAATASGSQELNGAGFTPAFVHVICVVEGTTAWSNGFGFSGSSESIIHSRGSEGNVRESLTQLAICSDGTNSQSATLTSFDNDGMTLSWTKGASGLLCACRVLYFN